MNDNKHIFIEAIQKKPVTRTPIWIMRQAGRYLPEYQEVRKKHDFIKVCKTPELATELTLQPIRRFAFDAAILFSDILVIPEAMGVNLEFIEDRGPKLSPQVLREDDLLQLGYDDLRNKLDYVSQAIKMILGELNGHIPLIGFSGSPFTLATYMIEGTPTRNFKHVKTIMYSNPRLMHQLLDLLTNAVTQYLIMQIEAGVQAVQIFDTWGGIVPPHMFETYSGNYMKKIVRLLKFYNIPVTLFSKGGIGLLAHLIDSGANMLGIDWMTDMAEAKALAGKNVALQGNLDPTALYGTRDVIKEEVAKILAVFGNESGHVFNLGHGILPDVPVENVQFLVDEVRRQSEQLHSQGSF